MVERLGAVKLYLTNAHLHQIVRKEVHRTSSFEGTLRAIVTCYLCLGSGDSGLIWSYREQRWVSTSCHSCDGTGKVTVT
jgi:DnaJ-class molecular chaperone